MQEAHTCACAMTALERPTFETAHWALTLSCTCGIWVASTLELGCPYTFQSFSQAKHRHHIGTNKAHPCTTFEQTLALNHPWRIAHMPLCTRSPMVPSCRAGQATAAPCAYNKPRFG